MDYRSQATPRETTPDGTAVFCRFDEIVDIDELKPNPANPNTHGKRQIKMLGDIIKSTGWRAPITVSKRSGFITKGHGRLMAAQEQHLKYVPIEYQEYTNEDEEHADLIADNRIAELAEIDVNKLSDLIGQMETSIPVELTGYTQDDLQKLIGQMEQATATKTKSEPPLSGSVFSKSGDLWHLGEHRLICGNATDEKTIRRLTNGQKAQVVHTDPPYGVSYDGSYRKDSINFGQIKNDDIRGDTLIKELLIPAFKNCIRHANDDAAFYIWHAEACRREFEDAMIAAGLVEKQRIIWVKGHFAIAHCDYQWAHEPCFYAEKAGQKAAFFGDRAQWTYWRIASHVPDGAATTLTGGLIISDGNERKLYLTAKPPKGKRCRNIRLTDGGCVYLTDDNPQSTTWEITQDAHPIHPTQKPVEIPLRAITNSSRRGDVVLDLFGGSGSTLIAAQMSGRVCFMSELDPKYCDGIVKRYVGLIGDNDVYCERDGEEISYNEAMSAVQ